MNYERLWNALKLNKQNLVTKFEGNGRKNHEWASHKSVLNTMEYLEIKEQKGELELSGLSAEKGAEG